VDGTGGQVTQNNFVQLVMAQKKEPVKIGNLIHTCMLF